MKFLLPFLLAFTCLHAAAQNHVPNASFEQYNNCPTTLGQVIQSAPWRQYTSGSSDYFNACSSSSVDVPLNLLGVQAAAHGDAYMGVITYQHSINGGINYKEYIAAPITPLQIGTMYEVSMSVSLADYAGWAADDLGVYFYDSGPNTVPMGVVLAVTPQVSYSNYGTITDKTNWIRLSAFFTADSAYDNMVIGGFTHTNSLNPTQVTGNGTGVSYSYYYIDSVVVKTIDSLAINIPGNLLCGTDSFLVNYVALNGLYSPPNVFTIQLSDANGSFATPINIGAKAATTGGTIKVGLPGSLTPGWGYRMRIVSTNTADTSADNGFNIAIGMTTPVKPVATSNSPLCSGNNLDLSATTSGTVTGWVWTGPNNFSSTVSGPTIANAAATASGSYIVKAFNYGCVSADTEIVSVAQAPNAVTATSNSPVCAADTIKLTATNNLAGATYSWTGPGSFSAGTQNLNITPATTAHSGDYVVTVTLNGCQKKDTVTVLVHALPAGFSATATSPVCEGDTIKLRSFSSTQGVTYSWTGPSGFSSFLPDADILNAAGSHAGDYIVTCTHNLCQVKDTLAVQVKALPSPVIATNNGPVCEGATLGLAVTQGFSGTTFSWVGPNTFTATGATTSVANASMQAGGDYVVTANFNGCIKKDTTTAVIKPVPAVTASSSGAVCNGQSVMLSATSSLPGSGFSWTGPASFSSTLQNPTLSPATLANNGSYSVTATLNGCTSAAATVNVTVHAIPATPAASSNSPVCAGGTLNLFASSATTGVNYTWTGPNGFAAATQNANLSPVPLNAGGSYNVTAELNGCVSPAASAAVTVNNVSSLGVYPSPNDTLCVNNTNASFTAVPFNAGTAPQYQWFKNNNPIGGATNITYPASNIADGDSFYCRMTVTGLCADPLILYSNKLGMTVLPLTSGPSVSITADPGTLLSPWQLVKFTAVAGNAGALPKYQWKRNSQDVIGANSETWSANNLSNGDTISCVVTSDVWCASPSAVASNRMVVNIKTGITDIDAERKLILYPNPNNGSFLLNMPLLPFKGGNIRVEVVNAVAQSVYSCQFPVPGSEFQITVPNSVPNGVYVLKLYADGAVYHARLVVSR